MPRRKRTPTTSTSGPSGRGARRARQVKSQVAAEAARIMATEGQNNFLAAKTKAAERLGVSSRLALPSNLEVQDALRTYQNLYGGEAHADTLRHLRATACEAMAALDRFKPRLVGPVLDGTAHAHSRVSLQVFSDPADEVAMHLMERGLPFREEIRRLRWHDGDHREVPVLVIEAGDATVELMVLREVDLRQAPPSPVDGKPQRRAALHDVELLLAQTEPERLLGT